MKVGQQSVAIAACYNELRTLSMAPMTKPQDGELSRPAFQLPGRNWISVLMLGLGLAAVYAANWRPLGNYDTVPTTMMLLTLARGEGVYLDRFRPRLHDTNRVLPVFVRPWRTHILSRYPAAPAILVQPFVLPQVEFLDWLRPGWDRIPGGLWKQLSRSPGSRWPFSCP